MSRLSGNPTAFQKENVKFNNEIGIMRFSRRRVSATKTNGLVGKRREEWQQRTTNAV
jgi:hypothetical protein